MSIVRVGLIGLGEVSQLMHLPLLADHSQLFQIAGVFDVSPSLTAHCAARYPGARAFETAEALVAAPDIDAVFILTPDQTHGHYLTMALNAGKHIFLEKPACLTVGEIDAATPLAQASDKLVFVAYMRRYSSAFLRAKAMLPQTGDIRYVRVRDIICEGPFFIRQTRNIFYPKDLSPEFLSQSRADTTALLEQVVGKNAPADLARAYQVLTGLSSHSLSAMRELIGLPKRVIAAHHKQNGESIVALFDYGHFTAIYEALIDNVARFDARIEILTDTRQMRIGYDTPYIRNLPTSLEVTESTGSETSTTIHGPDYSDPFALEIRVFHEHLTAGTKPKTTLADSREDLVLMAEIVERLKQSADNRGTS